MATDITDAAFVDRHGKRLDEYPRPSVAVDTALLTVVPDGDRVALSVLQVRRVNDAGWGLPGTFVHPGERLIDAVRRSLRDKAGVRGLRPRQLCVFDDPRRDDRGWVMSIAHVDVVPLHKLDSRTKGETRLVPTERPGRMPYDHAEIIKRAVEELRGRYAERPDPDHLLPKTFTMRELRRVHEAVLGAPLQRDNFRRGMESHLAPTGDLVTRGPGRPAELFRHIAGQRTESS